jgi:hypothetical protein
MAPGAARGPSQVSLLSSRLTWTSTFHHLAAAGVRLDLDQGGLDIENDGERRMVKASVVRPPDGQGDPVVDLNGMTFARLRALECEGHRLSLEGRTPC